MTIDREIVVKAFRSLKNRVLEPISTEALRSEALGTHHLPLNDDLIEISKRESEGEALGIAHRDNRSGRYTPKAELIFPEGIDSWAVSPHEDLLAVQSDGTLGVYKLSRDAELVELKAFLAFSDEWTAGELTELRFTRDGAKLSFSRSKGEERRVEV